MQQAKQTSFVMPALMVAVLAVSFSAVLVKLAQAPPLVIAVYRLLFTVVLLAPPALYYHKAELKGLTKRDISLSLLSGFFLAVHFFSWMASLQYMTVAAPLLLVSLHPIIVGLLGAYLLGEKSAGAYWFGLVLAILGIAVMGVGDILSGSSSWPGGLLALLGAVTMAAYLLLGRTLRRSISTLTYTLWVYGSAALCLLLVSFLTSTPPLSVCRAGVYPFFKHGRGAYNYGTYCFQLGPGESAHVLRLSGSVGRTGGGRNPGFSHLKGNTGEQSASGRCVDPAWPVWRTTPH